MCCWFANVLCFLQVLHTSLWQEPFQFQKVIEIMNDISTDGDRELCSVKWNEVLKNEGFFIDYTDEVLNCICLRWQRTPEEKNMLLESKTFGLVQLEGIGPVVRVAPKDQCLRFVDGDNCRKLYSRDYLKTVR